MSEKSKVYAVSSGCYSDYSIIAVFSTREKAEAFVEAHNARESGQLSDGGEWRFSYGAEAAIEEWDLDVPPPAGRGCYVAWIQLEGGYPSFYHDHGDYVRWEEGGDASRPGEVVHSDSLFGKDVTVRGYGETREHAARSARELHRAIRAGAVIVPAIPTEETPDDE